MSSDSNLKKLLLENIKDLFIPTAPQKQEANFCLFLEEFGFSIDPKIYDKASHTLFKMCDRIPDLSCGFEFESESSVSGKWEQLLSDHWLSAAEQDKDDSWRLRDEKFSLGFWDDRNEPGEFGSNIEQKMFNECQIGNQIGRDDDINGEVREKIKDVKKVMEKHSIPWLKHFFEIIELDPADWCECFKDNYIDDDGWNPVTINAKESYNLLKVSFSSDGTGYAEERAGYTTEACEFTVKLKVRRVNINRPWLDCTILECPNLGMREVPKHNWSDGSLDAETNKGTFPLLPAAFIVAKDIVISDHSSSADHVQWERDGYSNVSLGCLTVAGDFHFKSEPNGKKKETGLMSTSFEYDKENNAVKINGSQIIGWVCSAMPPFPQVEKK